ncbi:Protein of unknown function [Pyronema omphalodes CBS 100304]|uniref:Uncharacterized protein n=1 Tax=Pyronema omphalodes (strain CBS 100304) TaxID=1076935 RepID=U4L2C3_PYROM|nr:Protein of unknown function [Pyronema omphalodes CBS 100304]
MARRGEKKTSRE